MMKPQNLFFLMSVFAAAACDDTPESSELRSTITCATNHDCPSDQPECHPQVKVCVGCISGMTTCPVGQICEEGTHRCVPRPANYPECTRNSECPPITEASQRSICRVETGVCVECLVEADCGDPKPACDNAGIGGRPPTFACVDGCATCVPPTPVCDRANRRCLTIDGMELDAGVRDGS